MFLVWVPAAVDLSVKFAAGVSRVRSGLQIALAILPENALVAAQALIILMGYQILKTLLPECKYLPWRMEGPAGGTELPQGAIADTCNFCLICLANKCH